MFYPVHKKSIWAVFVDKLKHVVYSWSVAHLGDSAKLTTIPPENHQVEGISLQLLLSFRCIFHKRFTSFSYTIKFDHINLRLNNICSINRLSMNI